MAEERTEAAQAKLEREFSGLRRKGKRHFRPSAMHVKDIDSWRNGKEKLKKV